MKKVGLLAGVGNLPVEYARAMKDAGRIVVTVALVPGSRRRTATGFVNI